MGSLAGLLKDAGHEVSGSDVGFYPPMAEKLREWRIPTIEGYLESHVTPDIEMVIVGNACRKDNPEARAAFEKGIRVLSFPLAVREFFLSNQKSIVVTGTHGKTTTTALLAYLLVEAGQDPSFLVGGIPRNFGKSYRLGDGDMFVIEGDEYDSAFFDKRPKFLHYRPNIAVLTSVEYDHADIYPDMSAYRAAFAQFLDLLPSNGLLLAYSDDPEVEDLMSRAGCRVIPYGLGEHQIGWRAVDIKPDGQGMRFRLMIYGKRKDEFFVPLPGRHNVANTLAALAVAHHLGVSLEDLARYLSGFQSVTRRMEIRGVQNGVTVLDDFAHHPTAVRETLDAVRNNYPSAHLVAVFEPRTNTSRRNIFQNQYSVSFTGADQVIVLPPFRADQIPEGDRFDSSTLVQALIDHGQKAQCMESVERVVAHLTETLEPGSVVLIMSNGAVDNIHNKLLDALRQKESNQK